MVGAGLAGGLLALEAADRGAKVCIISTAPMATPISYGGVHLAALEQWQRLEKRHGFLGLEPAELLLYWLEDQKPNIPPGAQRLAPSQWRGLEPLLVDAPLGGVVAMPYARVDPLVLTEKLTKALAAAGGATAQSAAARPAAGGGGGARLQNKGGGGDFGPAHGVGGRWSHGPTPGQHRLQPALAGLQLGCVVAIGSWFAG